MVNPKLLPVSMNVIVRLQKNKPAIELRRCINDPDVIKAIISATWHNTYVIIAPKFNDRMQSIASLQKKGFLIVDPDTGDYHYTF